MKLKILLSLLIVLSIGVCSSSEAHCIEYKEIIFNNEFYRASIEKDANKDYQLRLKKYDSDKKAWEYIDDFSVNYDTKRRSFSPELVVYKDELFIIWSEQNNYMVGEIQVKKYNPLTNKISSLNEYLINCNETKFASCPKAVIFDDELYIAWQEESGYRKTDELSTITTSTLNFKKYNKYTNKWTMLNTSSLNTNSLNDYTIKDFKLIDNKIYIKFNEEDENYKNNVKFKIYDVYKDTWVDTIYK